MDGGGGRSLDQAVAGTAWVVVEIAAATEPSTCPRKARLVDISLKFGETMLTIPRSAIVAGLPSAARDLPEGAPVKTRRKLALYSTM